MKNHAFLFQIHKQPSLVKRILKVLEKENHYFFINIDNKVKDKKSFYDELSGIKNVIYMPKMWNVYHCGHSQFLCTIDMLKYAMNYGIDFSYYHQTSGQDYPMRSNEQFDAFFEHTNKSYVCLEGQKFHDEQMLHAYPLRVSYWYPSNPNNIMAHLYYKLHIREVFSRICKRQNINDLWGGWSWFSWNKELVVFILNYIDNHPRFLKRFMYTSAGDELIFNTVIHSHISDLNVEPYMPLRFVAWNLKRKVNSPYRPYTLNEEDYDEIINKQAFFCRKVNLPESEKLLDMIDNQRGQYFDIQTAEHLFPHLAQSPDSKKRE